MKVCSFVRMSCLKRDQPAFVQAALDDVELEVLSDDVVEPILKVIRKIDDIVLYRQLLYDKGDHVPGDFDITIEHYHIVRSILVNLYSIHGEDLHILFVEKTI